MSRFALFFIVCCLWLTFIYQCRERVSLGITLLATFTRFPTSNLNIINISTEQIDSSTSTHRNDSNAVPAIIHQVLLGDLHMRPEWQKARSSCQALHPTWTLNLWQDNEANTFVHQHYHHLYSIYTNYPLEIQRSNVLRYLLLHHYGGVYLDLDLHCLHQFDFLRNETFLTPPANPTGVNNAFIVSSKGHPFWTHLINNLPRYNLDWYSPYLTNMFSTGCHFFSTMHRTYPDQANLKILDSTHKLNGHVITPLFEHLGASSWHKGDAKIIIGLGLFVEQVKQAYRYALHFSIAVVLVLGLLYTIIRRRKHRMSATSYKEVGRCDMESN